MSQTKLATIRYQTLDRCFSNWGRRYYIEDLISACNESLREYLGEDAEVKRRQIFDDIRFMESESGWAVPLDHCRDGKRIYYRYSDKDFSINKRPMSPNEARQLRLQVLLKEASARPEGLPLETALLQRCRDYFEDKAEEVLAKVGISDVDRYLEALKHKIDNPDQQ